LLKRNVRSRNAARFDALLEQFEIRSGPFAP
jgi:hypothetical protein